MENKFYKVKQDGGTFIVATFFNPITREVKTECVRDYDYSDCSRDNDTLYYMPIDEDAKRLYLRHIGVVSAGDMVKVVKGRKIPVGTVARVQRLYDFKDQYGRFVTRYAVFEDGRKTSVRNLVIID